MWARAAQHNLVGRGLETHGVDQHAVKRETAYSSKVVKCFYQTTQHHIPN